MFIRENPRPAGDRAQPAGRRRSPRRIQSPILPVKTSLAVSPYSIRG